MEINRRPQHYRISAFTLVELLVVIAIIGLLATLLLPAIRTAKENSEGVRCLGNLRQLAAAAILYESDHEGYLVPVGTTDTSEGWTQALDPYVGNATDIDEWRPGTATGAAHPYTCPVQARFSPNIQTYAENHYLMDWTEGAERPFGRAFMLRDGRSDPGRWPATSSTIPYFMDGIYRFGHPFPIPARRHLAMNRALSTEEGIRRSHPHRYGCNIVFLDGHAERMEFGKGIFESTSNAFRPRYLEGPFAF